MVKNLSECVLKSLKAKNTRELNAKFSVEVEGRQWSCYTVAISNREFTLYCNEGTATFLVDSYGDKNTCELFDWQRDNE